jgi:hypothetical protein
MAAASRKTKQCKLCGTFGPLRKSHYLPRSAYKLVRESEGDSPVVINSDVAIKTDKQTADYLLCDKCEQRFSTSGEEWIMEHCNRGKAGFKLNEILASVNPVYANEWIFFPVDKTPEIDRQKIAYFAASVIWRGGVHQWKSLRADLPKLSLSKYELELSKFLLGTARFPANGALLVGILSDRELWDTFTFPRRDLNHRGNAYKFHFMGLSFKLFLGGGIEPFVKSKCFISSAMPVIIKGNPIDFEVVQDIYSSKQHARLVDS